MLDNEKKLIDVIFMDNTEELISAAELVNAYLKEYNSILIKYADYYREGTGYKTNRYHEPVMNKAYNYIEHDDFKKVAVEPIKGYDKNNRPISKPIEYIYYMSVWSIACSNIEKKYSNAFKLKFDHRKVDHKNVDNDGFLFCYKKNSSWLNRNLPRNQRY